MFSHWGMGFCPRTIYFPIQMVLVIVPPLNNSIITSKCSSDFGHLISIDNRVAIEIHVQLLTHD